MLVLSLMASTGCPPGLIFYQEQASSRALQDLQPLLANPVLKQELTRSSILKLMPYEQDDLFKNTNGFKAYNQYVKKPSTRTMPLFVDVQDMHEIEEQWMKHKHMLRRLMSGSSGSNEEYLDRAVLPELMGLQTMPDDVHLPYVARTEFEWNNSYEERGPLLHPDGNYFERETDSDLVYDFPSALSAQSERQLPFIGTITEMRDLISVLEEFSLRKDPAQWRRQTVLVPQFRWNDTVELQDRVYQSSLKLEAIATAPLKSPEKVKFKPAPKRKNKKASKERNPYRNNSFHACESLLSLMMDKKRNGKSVMNVLKKSGPELPQLLTQFSASIAGTGLAVIFSVLCKVACGNVPFCASNLLTSGFGAALFCLSWAVNKLRDTIVYIGKNSSKLGFEEEEMMTRVEKSVNDIFFRAAASMVVLLLRFA